MSTVVHLVAVGGHPRRRTAYCGALCIVAGPAEYHGIMREACSSNPAHANCPKCAENKRRHDWKATHVLCDAFGKRTNDYVMLIDGQFVGYGAWTEGECVGSMMSFPAARAEEIAPGRVRTLEAVRADEQTADAIECLRHLSDACCDECCQHITECCCRDEPRDEGEDDGPLTMRQQADVDARDRWMHR